jgi:glutaconyl-CoA/methylmalonyl-CoA decarboxylase subunit gamma
MKYRLERAGKVFEVDVQLTDAGYVLRGADGQPQLLQLLTHADGSQRAITPWGDFELMSARRGAELWADLPGRRLTARVERARPSSAGASSAAAVGAVRAPMAGKLLRLEVRLGDAVKTGQAVAVIEAMKMENELVAPLDGVVVELGPAAPSAIEKGALVARIEPT